MYKKLLGGCPSLADVEEVWPALARGLRALLAMEGEVEHVVCRCAWAAGQQSVQARGARARTCSCSPGREGGRQGGLLGATRLERVEVLGVFIIFPAVLGSLPAW